MLASSFEMPAPPINVNTARFVIIQMSKSGISSLLPDFADIKNTVRKPKAMDGVSDAKFVRRPWHQQQQISET